MKKVLLSLCFLCLCLFSCTDNSREMPLVVEEENPYYLSIEKAKQEVEDIIAARALTRSGYFEPTRKIASIWTAKDPSTRSGHDPEQQEVYIMNFEDSAGFAIVSSDNRIGLMGLALQGSLNQGDVIEDPGFGMTLSNLYSLSYYADSSDVGDDQYDVLYGDWSETFYEPSYGYCPVKWGQGAPYWRYCYTTEGLRAFTGCAATAVAQLMSIYKYPTSYQQYSFNWDEMIADPYYADSTGSNPVARLMSLLGTPNNLNVEYGVDSSSTDILNIPRTFENFGYTSGGTVSDYMSSTVISELQLGYPILINGYSLKTTTVISYLWGWIITDVNVTYSGGHAWLGHGMLVRTRPVYHYLGGQYYATTYENRYYILCNFGGEGDNDGYYLSSAFNTIIGPSYGDDYHTRSTSVTTEGAIGDYKYMMQMVTGIRR